MTLYDPNGDEGAQYIAYTDAGTAITRPVLGWGNDNEGWPHLTPVVGGQGGVLPLPYDPARTFTYGPTAEDAEWALGDLRARRAAEENR